MIIIIKTILITIRDDNNNRLKLVTVFYAVDHNGFSLFLNTCLFRSVPLFITTSVDNYNLQNETEQDAIKNQTKDVTMYVYVQKTLRFV